MSKAFISMQTKILFIILIIVCGIFVYNFRAVYHYYNHSDYNFLEDHPVRDVREEDFGEEIFQLSINDANIDELLSSSDSFIRQKCSLYEKTSEQALLKLAQDPDVYVRRCVALNPSLKESILSILAKDEDNYVKRLVLRHPNTTKELVYEMASEKIAIQWDIARSNYFDETVWNTFNQKEIAFTVLMEIANNYNCPPVVLEKLADQKEKKIRRSVAQNPSASLELLKKLQDDDDPETSLFASQNLKKN